MAEGVGEEPEQVEGSGDGSGGGPSGKVTEGLDGEPGRQMVNTRHHPLSLAVHAFSGTTRGGEDEETLGLGGGSSFRGGVSKEEEHSRRFRTAE